jgi:hypothetical protein
MLVKMLVLEVVDASLCRRWCSPHAMPTILSRGRRRYCHMIAVIRADGVLSTRPIDNIEDRSLAVAEGRGGRLRLRLRLRLRGPVRMRRHVCHMI